MATILPSSPPIQVIDVEFADGRKAKVSVYQTYRRTGRRMIVHIGKEILHDTGDQYDSGNALNSIDLWLQSTGLRMLAKE